MRNIIIMFSLALFFGSLGAGCGGQGRSADDGRIVYVVTIHPVAAIMKEVVGDRAEVVCLLGSGASPHTYAPRPSDARKVQGASALVYVGKGLDTWAAGFSAARKIELMGLLPAEYRLRMAEHGHGGHGDGVSDPHFWTDPLAVKAMLPVLVEVLCELDPDGGETYRTNAETFSGELDALHAELQRTLQPVKGEAVFLFHPSLRYFLKRYGLEMAGVVEPFPGKEPTAEYIRKMKRVVAERGVKAVFTEPQLPEAPARVIAEETGTGLFVLDPLGGVEGRGTYAELLRYNAKVLLEALK